MIDLINVNNSEPYNRFSEYYYKALTRKQFSPEAVSISSFNSTTNEVESRFVNLKYIIDDEWIFFSNYNSQKAKDFQLHDQISVLFLWSSINIQIRIKAKIKQTSESFSDEHFKKRSIEKNALAISSYQSELIDSYNNVIKNYESTINNKQSLLQRPEYWGGYAFIPYYFEFWEGHESRLNKRTAFYRKKGDWNSHIPVSYTHLTLPTILLV